MAKRKSKKKSKGYLLPKYQETIVPKNLKSIDSFYDNPAAMGSYLSYPYRTLQDPSYGDIRINLPQYHDPNTIQELRLEKRLRPTNITPEMMQTGGKIDLPKYQTEGDVKPKQEEVEWDWGDVARLGILGPLGYSGLEFAKHQVAENLKPVGYGKPLERIGKAIMGDSAVGSKSWFEKREEEGKKTYNDTAAIKERQALLSMMLKKSGPSQGITISEYKPSNSKEEDAVYYDSAQTKQGIIDRIKTDPNWRDKFTNNKNGVPTVVGRRFQKGRNVLGNYTLQLGKDEKGEYISYYDIWDLNPYKGKNDALNTITDGLQSFAGVNAPEIYGRVYIDEVKDKTTANDLYQKYNSYPTRQNGGLLKYQTKGKVQPQKPLLISDLNEFNKRKVAYDDSTKAYNQSVEEFKRLGDVFGLDPSFGRGASGRPHLIKSFEELPQAVWRHSGDPIDYPGWVHMPNSTMGNYVSIYDNNTTIKASDPSIGDPASLGNPSITTQIMPTVVAEARGSKFMNFYPKPKQPVKYNPTTQAKPVGNYDNPDIRPTMAKVSGNYDNPDRRPGYNIKMPDGSIWTKEKYIKRYGQANWDKLNKERERAEDKYHYGGRIRKYQNNGRVEGNVNDWLINKKELEDYYQEYERMASKCRSGKCLERASMYYDQNVAGLLGTPKYNTIKDNAGIPSSNPYAENYKAPHSRYEEYGHSADSWDIHGLLQEKGAKQIYAYPLKQKDGNDIGTLEYTKARNNFKNKPLEEKEQFFRDMKMPIGSFIGLGMRGGSGGKYGTSSYNKEKGLIPSNHSAVVVGYDETGLPYIYDWNSVRPITDTYLGMMVTNITAPKEVEKFTYDYLKNTGELADTYRPLKLKVSDKETNSDYDVDEFDPFIKALEDNKLEISNSLGISFSMYDELAKRAVATAISETEGGNNNIWRFGAGAGPLRIAPSYITDKLGFGNTTGITQINEDLIWARVGTEEERKGNRMPGKLNALGIEEETYDPWDPEQQAKATIAFLYDNLEVGRQNLKSGVNKETGTRNKLDLPDEEVGYYQWFQPSLMYKGEAWGESEKVKNFRKAYAKVSLGYSDQPTEETPTELSPPASASRQYGGEVEQDPLYASLLNTFQNGGKIDSYQSGTEVLENIYKNYPGLKNLGEVTLKPDTSFTREKTGIGDIEYFSPTQDSVRYSNYTVPHPNIGTHGILYNPNTNTEQNIALDMLHGMSSVDPKYKKLRNNLKKKILSSKFNNDIEHYWKEYNSEFKENDGKESFVDNYVDGIIRGLLFEGSDEDFENARYSREANEAYLKNKEINNEFDKLKSYIKGYENGGEVLAEQPMQQELPYQEVISYPVEREPAGDPRVPRFASAKDYYTNLENTPVPKTISKKYKIWEDTYKSPMGLSIKSYKNIYDIQAFFNSGDWKESFENIENYRKSSHPMIGSVDPKTNTFIPSEENLNTNEEIASHIDINAIPVNFKKVERIPINPDGFAPGSATEFADKVIIPGNNITMKDMQEPILANGEVLMPGEEAQFDAPYVVEEKLPKAQDGLTVEGKKLSKKEVDDLKNFVEDDTNFVQEYPYLLPEVVIQDKLDRTNPVALRNWSREHDPIAYAAREAMGEAAPYVATGLGVAFAPAGTSLLGAGARGLAAAGEATYGALAPYGSAAWNASIPGMSSVPGATVGNLINAGFATHGATNIAPDALELLTNPLSLENLGNVGIDALEMAPMYGPMSKMLGELGTVGKVGTPSKSTSSAAIEGVLPTIKQPIPSKPAPWSLQEIPGLHLKSTMSTNPKGLHTQVNKKGQINVENALKFIKNNEGEKKYEIIRKGFGDDLPKNMDYNKFRKVVQDQLIPLERQFATNKSNYGINNLGYNVGTNVEERLTEFKEILAYKQDLLKTATDANDIAKINDQIRLAKKAIERYSKEFPVENQTLILSNKNRLGYGSGAHGNPEETLGHIHFLRDAETPNTLTVTQIQSDAFQGANRSMPKTKEAAEYSLKGNIKHLEAQKENWKKAVQLPNGNWQYPDGMIMSNEMHLDFISSTKGQEAINAAQKVEIENFSQKQLLDKNHQERYLQELVNYAGERGDVSKLRLPTSETAAKIQSYSKTTPNPELKRLKEEISSLHYNKHNNLPDKLIDSKEFRYSPKEREAEIIKLREQIANIKEPLSYSSEHKTILKKYSENPKTLKKLYGKEPTIVTDNKGNTWYEFDIPKSYLEGKAEIKAFEYGGKL